jgi:hypothetical protein
MCRRDRQSVASIANRFLHATAAKGTPGRVHAACARRVASCAHRRGAAPFPDQEDADMIRKLKSGEYRLYSRKMDPRTGKRRNLGTFRTRAAAERHEREIQYFKRH